MPESPTPLTPGSFQTMQLLLDYELENCSRYRRYASMVMFVAEKNAENVPAFLARILRRSDRLFRTPLGYSVLMGETSRQGALEAIRRYQQHANGDFHFRYGVSAFPEDGTSASELIHAAMTRTENACRRSAGAIVDTDETDRAGGRNPARHNPNTEHPAN